MECSTVLDCVRGLIAATDSPNWVEVASLVVSAAVSTLGILVALHVGLIPGRRFGREDRERLRAELRDWFQTLSTGAPQPVRDRGPAIRARIEDVVDAEGFDEIYVAMRWAKKMHRRSHKLSSRGRLTPKQAHERRSRTIQQP